MKNATIFFQYLILGIILILLAACDINEDGSTTSGFNNTQTPSGSAGTAVLNGVVADGYLSGARVFLDRNNNRSYDNGEPSAMTTAGGAYSLTVNSGEGELYPVVAEIITGQTVDEDSGLTVAESYQLESIPGKWQFVSPLTTLVGQELDKNPSFTELKAVLKVRTELGIDDNVSLFDDYLAHGSGGEQASDALLAEEYSRAHKAARIVAGLMGYLHTEIARNLGEGVAEAEKLTVAYMVSDQIFEQAPEIKQSLDNERNTATSVDVTALTTSIKGSLNVSTLNAELLSLYKLRDSQDLPNWDMRPPAVLSQSPPTGDTASIDVTVGIVFDEPLDETLIDSNAIQLSGPNGLHSGVVSYDAVQNRLSFVPDQVLLPFTTYQVILNKDLTDTLGNPLREDLSWTFTTVFDQTPPPLPVF